jgi:hypothetical protein
LRASHAGARLAKTQPPPNEYNAGCYAGVLHWLKGVKAANMLDADALCDADPAPPGCFAIAARVASLAHPPRYQASSDPRDASWHRPQAWQPITTGGSHHHD